MVLNVELHSHHYRLGFISQWGALAGRYAALYPTGFPWSTTAQRMPFHSSNGKNLKSILDTFLAFLSIILKRPRVAHNLQGA